MIFIQSAPILLLISLLILFVGGLLVLTWGHRLPGKGGWVLAIGLLLLLGNLGLNSGLISQIEFKKKIWLAGWIWPRGEMGALTLGVFQDPLSLAVAGIVLLLTSAVLVSRTHFSEERHVERVFASLAFSTVGVILAWSSLTPWLVLMGMVLTLFGGFISYGSQWQSPVEADAVARFLRGRAMGFLFLFYGACILATSRPALLFNEPTLWVPDAHNFESTWVGSILLILGLFIQFQPFPFLGWVVSQAESYPPSRVVLTQIYPAWAAYALLIRLNPYFQSLGLFPGFGWIALICCSLSILSGLFQKDWHSELRVWQASGFSLAVAILAFSGPMAGFGMLLGVSLGVFALSGIGFELKDVIKAPPAVSKVSTKNRAVILKVLAFLAVSAGTGGFGFVSATSGISWISHRFSYSGELPFYLFSLFLFSTLGWKLGWGMMRSKKVQNISWTSLISPTLATLLSFAIVWTGSVTGGLFLDLSDQVTVSLFDKFFGTPLHAGIDSQSFFTVSGLYWGTLILAFAFSFWIAGRKENPWSAFMVRNPRLTQFLASGYEIDGLAEKFIRALISLGRGTESLVDFKIWSDWIPSGLSSGIKSFSNLFSRADVKISSSLGKGLQIVVDAPVRLLMVIQNGDLRWYLIFVFGSSFALLLHFFYLLNR